VTGLGYDIMNYGKDETQEGQNLKAAQQHITVAPPSTDM